MRRLIRSGRLVLVLSLAAGGVLGCAAEPKYHWGSYEKLLYQMQHNPGEATPEAQADKLTRDIQEASGKGKPVPPGVHAHLAYMLLMTGNGDGAMSNFQIEKTKYPESAVMIDRLVAGMTGKPKKAGEPVAPKGTTARPPAPAAPPASPAAPAAKGATK